MQYMIFFVGCEASS